MCCWLFPDESRIVIVLFLYYDIVGLLHYVMRLFMDMNDSICWIGLRRQKNTTIDIYVWLYFQMFY